MEKLNTKLKQLSLGVTRTKSVLDAGKIETIKRHLDALRQTVREANDCKRAAEETKIENGESLENITNWNDEVEEKIGQADVEVRRLAEWLTEKERSEQLKAQEMQFNTELKYHEKKLKMKTELELSHSTPEVQKFTGFKTVKLPKLVISKFDGTSMVGLRSGNSLPKLLTKV